MSIERIFIYAEISLLIGRCRIHALYSQKKFQLDIRLTSGIVKGAEKIFHEEKSTEARFSHFPSGVEHMVHV